MKCLWCDKELTDKQSRRGTKTCNHSCSGKYRFRESKREFVCVRCGNTYTKKNNGMHQGTKYCGLDCYHSARKGVFFSDSHCKKIAAANVAEKIRIKGDFKCDRCGRSFTSNTSLRAHKAHCGHVLSKAFCFKCGKSYNGLAALQRHQIWCLSENHEAREKIKTACRKSIKDRLKSGLSKSVDTNIEVAFEDGLNRLGIGYEKQYVINGCNHSFDFYIKAYNTIVECDGDYWHGNTARFPVLTKRQKRQLLIDVAYAGLAESQGYVVRRFWGSRILKDLDGCLKECCDV